MIIYQSWIKRQDLRMNPKVCYVFGDNLVRQGYGGQAKEMRGEPNAIGVPTKVSPTEFMCDHRMADHWPPITYAFNLIESILERETVVIWPADGLGTGLSEMPKMCPKIFEKLERLTDTMKRKYNQ